MFALTILEEHESNELTRIFQEMMKKKMKNLWNKIKIPIFAHCMENVVKQGMKKPRSSNLELYRILCMLMIVAHHYLVNSGLMSPDGPILSNPDSPKSVFLLVFGAWGKVGINCFLMITGYFMCKSEITCRKFLKLLLQIYFYTIIIYLIFLIFGYETISPMRLVKLIMPFWTITNQFSGSYLVFFLTIPFLNILVRNMTRRQHLLLIVLLLTCYTVLGSIPTFDVRFNYITWFGILYIIASYIGLYPHKIFTNKALWGWLSLTSIIIGAATVAFMPFAFSSWFFFLVDCNKILAVAVAVCTFLWFKNLKLAYSKTINTIAAGTFGVLLIHANSNAMRTWLWKDTVDCVGHYFSLNSVELILFSIGAVLAIFMVCNLIDQVRIATVERWFFGWYDRNEKG
jgi:hypothetical protein